MYIKSNKSSKANHTFKKLSFFIFLFVCSVFTPTANAQCAMCRAALTSEGNATQAAAVNDGIVYLMVIPYILVAGIGYAIYRMKKNKS